MFKISIFTILFSAVFAVISHAGPYQNTGAASSCELLTPERGSKRQFNDSSVLGHTGVEELNRAFETIMDSYRQGNKRVLRDVLALAALSRDVNQHSEPGLEISPYSKQKKNAIYYVSNCRKTELPLIDLKGKVITRAQLKHLMQQAGLDVWLKQIREQKTPLYIGKTEQVMNKRRADHLSAARHHQSRPLCHFLSEHKENAYDRAIIINVHPHQLSAIEHDLIEQYEPSLNSVSGTLGHNSETDYFYGKITQEMLGPTSPTLEPEESPSCLAVRSLDF